VWISLPAGGIVGVPTLVLLFISFFAAPGIEQLFRDFKIDLPAVTKLALAVTQWVRNGWGWLLLLPLPVAVSVIVPAARGAQPAQPDTSDGQRFRFFSLPILTVLLSLGIILLFAAAFLLPLTQLIDALSSPRGK
jgi:type II secretory pathway component PulF